MSPELLIALFIGIPVGIIFWAGAVTACFMAFETIKDIIRE